MILLILKVIGIILLIVLAILAAVLLLILFVPVRYRACARFDKEKKSGTISVHWLLRLVSLDLDYNEKGDGSVTKELRLFGFAPKKMNERLNQKKKAKEPKSKGRVGKRMEEIRNENPKAYARFVKEEKEKKEGKKRRTPVKGQSLKERFAHFTAEVRKTTREILESAKELPNKIASILLSVIVFVIRRIIKFLTRLFALCGKIMQWIRFLTDERTRKAEKLVFHYVKGILKRAFPKDLKGEITYGMEDPYQTGVICAATSAILPFRKTNLMLNPDFTGKTLRGDLDISGSIRLYYVAFAAVRILLDRNVRFVVNHFKQPKEKV